MLGISKCQVNDLLTETSVETTTSPERLDGTTKSKFHYPSGNEIATISITPKSQKTIMEIKFKSENVAEVTITLIDSADTLIDKKIESISTDGNFDFPTYYQDVKFVTLDFVARNSDSQIQIDDLQIWTCAEGTTPGQSTLPSPTTLGELNLRTTTSK